MINLTKMICFFSFLVCLQLSGSQLAAFDLLELDSDDIGGTGFVLRGWPEDNISYMTVLNNTPPGIASVDWVNVVTDSFQSWTDITSSTVTLNHIGEIDIANIEDADSYYTTRYPETGSGPDTDTGENMVVVCIEDWEAAGLPSDALAVTRYRVDADSRYFLVADMFMNCDPLSAISWSIGAVDNSYDLQSVVTHEAGHFIGVGHPHDEGRESSTMWYMGSPNSIEPRTLELDDQNAAIYLYPANSSLVTTPDVIPPDNNVHGLRDTVTGEWTNDSPAIDPDNDPLVNGSGGGGGCSLSSTNVNAGAWLIPYALLFLVVFSSRSGRQLARIRRF